PALRLRDEVADATLQFGDDRLLLRHRQALGRDSVVELLLLGRVEGVDEPVDRLALVLGDRAERLAVVQLRLELCLRQAEVRRGRVELAEGAELRWADRRGAGRAQQREAEERPGAPPPPPPSRP